MLNSSRLSGRALRCEWCSPRSTARSTKTQILTPALLRFPNRIRMRIRRRFKPPAQRELLLSIKLHSFGALNVQITKERIVPAGERKPGHRRRDADVDADHACLETARKLAGGIAAAGKDTRAIAVFAV